MANANLLKVQNLKLFTPEGRSLLQNFGLEVDSGEVILVTGGNGTGKTTLLRCILGAWPHYRGEVTVALPPKDIAYLPQIQAPEVHMPLTLRDVLSLSVQGPLDEERVLEIGLLHREHLAYGWNTASGGEKKRTLLTRILLNHPKMIFLDEPFNHLDSASHDLIGTGLRNCVANKNCSLVIVSHQEKGTGFFDQLPLKRVQL